MCTQLSYGGTYDERVDQSSIDQCAVIPGYDGSTDINDLPRALAG